MNDSMNENEDGNKQKESWQQSGSQIDDSRGDLAFGKWVWRGIMKSGLWEACKAQHKCWYFIMIKKESWLKVLVHGIPLCVQAKSLQSCLTLCDPIDNSPQGSSVRGILQTSILPCSRGSFLRLLMSPASAGRCFTTSATWEAQYSCVRKFNS